MLVFIKKGRSSLVSVIVFIVNMNPSNLKCLTFYFPVNTLIFLVFCQCSGLISIEIQDPDFMLKSTYVCPEFLAKVYYFNFSHHTSFITSGKR